MIIGSYVVIVILFFIIMFLFSPLSYKSPFNISYNTGLLVMNSFHFFSSVKLFISSSILNDILAG